MGNMLFVGAEVGCSTERSTRVTHQIVLRLLQCQTKHVSIERVALLVHRGLAPATWLISKLSARWDGSVESRNL
jgi:hypothetical protein